MITNDAKLGQVREKILILKENSKSLRNVLREYSRGMPSSSHAPLPSFAPLLPSLFEAHT